MPSKAYLCYKSESILALVTKRGTNKNKSTLTHFIPKYSGKQNGTKQGLGFCFALQILSF